MKLSEFILCVEKRKLTLDFCLDLVGRCAAWKSFQQLFVHLVTTTSKNNTAHLVVSEYSRTLRYSHYSRAKEIEYSDWPWQQVRIQVKNYQFITKETHICPFHWIRWELKKQLPKLNDLFRFRLILKRGQAVFSLFKMEWQQKTLTDIW